MNMLIDEKAFRKRMQETRSILESASFQGEHGFQTITLMNVRNILDDLEDSILAHSAVSGIAPIVEKPSLAERIFGRYK